MGAVHIEDSCRDADVKRRVSSGGKKTEVEALTAKPVNMAVKKDAADKYEAVVTFKQELNAPIKAGDILGKLTYTFNGEAISNFQPVPLVAGEDVEEAGWFRLFFRGIKDVVTGIFSGISNSVGSISSSVSAEESP